MTIKVTLCYRTNIKSAKAQHRSYTVFALVFAFTRFVHYYQDNFLIFFFRNGDEGIFRSIQQVGYLGYVNNPSFSSLTEWYYIIDLSGGYNLHGVTISFVLSVLYHC